MIFDVNHGKLSSGEELLFCCQKTPQYAVVWCQNEVYSLTMVANYTPKTPFVVPCMNKVGSSNSAAELYAKWK